MSRYEIGPKEMKELDMNKRLCDLEETVTICVKSIDTFYQKVDTLEKALKFFMFEKITPSAENDTEGAKGKL
jgi:hypothetical protein